MGEVFDPLEVGDGYAAGVEVEVGDHGDAALAQDGVGLRGGGSVGGFGDDAGLDAGGVVDCDLVFQGGGDQDVALLLEDFVRLAEQLGGRVGGDAAVLAAVAADRFHIESASVVEGGVDLADADDQGAGVGQFACGVPADVAEALHDDALAGEPAAQPGGGVFGGVGQAVDDAVVDAEAGGFGAAGDAVQGDGFAGDAAPVVDVFRMQDAVGVGDPGHFALAGAVVGGGHIHGRADVVFLVEFDSQTAGDALDELGVALVRVDADAALCAAEGDIDEGAFEGHQGGEAHDLALADHGAVADAALGGQAVVGVLGAVGLDDFEFALPVAHGEVHDVNVVAGFDLGEESRVVAAVGRCGVEEGEEVAVEIGHGRGPGRVFRSGAGRGRGWRRCRAGFRSCRRRWWRGRWTCTAR